MTVMPACEQPLGEIQEVCVPATVQELDSIGGSVIPAINIANMTSITRVTGDCSSACVMIASRGTWREACSDSWFGQHQASNRDATERVLQFYREDERIDYEFMEEKIMSTEFFGMTYFPAHVALEHGVIDEVIDC